MSSTKRSRGRAYPCACGEEKLRLTRAGADLAVDGWGYLFGECGGGVKLRFQGARLIDTKPVDRAEADKIRHLPARRGDALVSMLDELDERTRGRLDQIVIEIRESLQQGMQRWVAVGQLLAEAKKLLTKKGDFGLWVERNGMDRVNAFKFIHVWETVQSLPAHSKTFLKIGQEKTVLLTRLTPAKRLEVLEDGVPVNGRPTPIEQVTFRQLAGFVRSVVGKSTRGRKAKGGDAKKPTERLGLPIEMFDAFQGTLKGLQALKKFAKDGWSDKQRPAVRQLWGNVSHLFFQLQDDHSMGELLS